MSGRDLCAFIALSIGSLRVGSSYFLLLRGTIRVLVSGSLRQ